jgi:hypothetical protein
MWRSMAARLARHYMMKTRTIREESMRNFARTASAGVILIGAVVAAEGWLKDDKLVASVEKKVREIQPSRDEKRFDEIGWAPSILAAEALAKKTNRPMFLFTYNGKIDTGRC